MRALFVLFILAPISLFCQSPSPIVFTDYGPIAFESFWRTAPQNFSDKWQFLTSSRLSNDRSSNRYFTQYLELSIPAGNNNYIQVRIPYHFFDLTSSEMARIQSSSQSGSSWGDLDFLFYFRILPNRKLLNDKMRLFVSAELHTAPTNRNERQFTDTIKMLGSVLAQFKLLESSGQGLLLAVLGGFGGWQDDVVPRQNHIVKLSSSLQYYKRLGSMKGLVEVGQTYLSGEKNNDKGWLVEATSGLALNERISTECSFKKLMYTEEIMKVTNQFELSFLFNLN